VFASRLHWRLLIATIVALMAAAWLAPRWLPSPDIQENRALAERPAWPKRLSDLAAFRKAADAYVADRFPIREQLISVFNRARMLVGVSGSSRVIIGRDGWLFYDDDTHLGAARNDPPLTAAETRAWLTTLAGRTEAVRAYGGTYLVVVPPVKEAIYPEHAPAWFHGPAPGRPSVSLPALAQASGVGQVVSLYSDVAAAKRAGQKVYSLHDTHWTGYGAYAGYVGLMNRLHAEGLTEGPLPLSSFQKATLYGRNIPRDLAKMLGVASYVHLDVPAFGNSQGESGARVTYLSPRQDWTAPQVVETGQAGKPTLLMTRDSFSSDLLPFLYGHFSRIILTHDQDGFWRPDMIERFKPDIVLLEVIEPGLRVAMGEGPAPSALAVARIERILPTEPSQGMRPSVPTGLAPPDAKTLAMMAAAKPAASCNLEAASLIEHSAGETTFAGSGWMFQRAAANTPDGLLALKGAGGTFVAALRMDLARPDVAAFFKDPAAAQSGFVGSFRIARLPPGPYAAAAYRHVGPGWIVCQGRQALAAP
jgi:hypothetical protein